MAQQSTRPLFEDIQAEMAHQDYKVRKEAIKRMMRYHRQQALKPLLAMLEDTRGDVRARAVQALGQLQDIQALVPIQGLLKDKNAAVRAQVARALGEFGDRSVVRLLIDLLNDPKPEICTYAALSLGKLRDPRSSSPLLAYLDRSWQAGAPLELYYAIQAVGNFGGPTVIEPLLTLLDRSTSPSVHWTIISALSKQEKQTQLLLLEILVDQSRSREVRSCVAQALARKPYPESLQSLIVALSDSYAMVRKSAAEALAKLQNPDAIEPLTRLLDDPEGMARAAAIRALGALRAIPVVERLITFLSFQSSSDRETRQIIRAAIEALGNLGDARAAVPLFDAFWRLNSYPYPNEIANALCKLNDSSIVEPFLQRMPAASSEQRWQIITLLEHFRDPRAVEPLLALLDVQVTDYSKLNFQKHVIKALGIQGDPRAVEPLRASLSLANNELHSIIQKALRALKVKRPVLSK